MTPRAWMLVLCLAAPSARAQEKLMFSPNGDGIKDDVTFRLNVPESASVSSWLFGIKDEAGIQVKSFSGVGRPPRELKWDGKDLDNRIVKDGTYLYSLSLVTEAGNQVAIAPSPVVVDRVPPQAAIAVDPPIFSPGSGGLKSETQFNLTTFDPVGIYSWLVTVKDKDGAPARQIAGKDAPPPAIRWDGRGDFQEDLPDGKYTVELTVEDPAGNRTTSAPKALTIKRVAPVSTVDITPFLFSPNGDGYKDEVTFKIHSADPESVDHWTLSVLNQGGRVVRDFSGAKEPPARIVWDGRTADKKVAADGTYEVVLSEVDIAGNTSTTIPKPLLLDTTPPFVQARLEPGLLSPGGKGYHAQGTFYLKAQDENPLDKWALIIANDVGQPVKTFSGSGGAKPPLTLTWNGESDDGKALNDGVYTYTLEAVDIGGNKGATPKQNLRIDNTPPLISISANETLFSPIGDSAHNQVFFSLSIQDASPIESWRLSLKDVKGNVVRSFTSPPDAIPPKIAWDGKNQDRDPLPDGDYTYEVYAKDIAGNGTSSARKTVTIGATRPMPQVSSQWRAISPNADGYKDDTTFHLQVRSFNRLQEWALKILDKAGQLRRTLQGRGDVPGNILWSGEGDDKRTLPDGEYTYTLSVVDIAGNLSQTLAQSIRIDTTPPELTMQVSPNPFSPNGDGFKDEAIFVLGYKDASPIGEWKLAIRNTRQQTVKTFSGKDRLPLSLIWKGDGEDGKILPDGPYTCVFSASDDVGNKASTPEQIVRIFDAPPVASLQADPTLFSPIAEGGKNETTLLLDAKSEAAFASWKIAIAGKDYFARTLSGLGRPPKSLPWDGKNDRGHSIPDGKYEAVLFVTDEVGNTGKSPGVAITIDTSKPIVTVTAETTELQELGPQMTVVQNQNKDLVISLASEVLFNTGEAVLKVQAYPTLMKAIYLIRRYPRRKVRIEGHADNVPIHNERFQNNQALSDARAKAVMRFFADKGKIGPARMSAKGYGDTRPRAPNDTESGRKLNRRVEIILQREAN